ncbi:uncharacterized protein LOC124933755 [Impatiens glandulifera]|uniref:uncharacterized protein LOC124933755 n=1 Tax=Impatiens glandulifera TaxID=253017 RepID=UPI001FB0C27D|nr:uncharacterized protein LOC124933755 [Impatiens glandulifera]
MSCVYDPEALYSLALLPLAYFNLQHKTDFEFHKILRGYFTSVHPMYIVFEAISPTIGGGGLPIVFQSHIGLRPGRPVREEVYFCKLHPIDCSYTLDNLPVCSSTDTFDHTKARVLAAAAYSTYEMVILSFDSLSQDFAVSFANIFMSHLPDQGRRLTLKDIFSFEEIAEPTLDGGFDFTYKITFNVFKTKDASYVSPPIETVVTFLQDFSIMEVKSTIEKEMPNEVKDDLNRERVLQAML